MKNLITQFMTIMAVGSVITLLFASPSVHADVTVPKGGTVVEVVEQTSKGFQLHFLSFPDQHTAEEFADQINAAPVVKYKPSWKVWRHATVYAK